MTTTLIHPSRPALSAGQAELVGMVAEGWTDARIARALGISESTVRRRLTELRRKLGVTSRIALAVQAAMLGYVPRIGHNGHVG